MNRLTLLQAYHTLTRADNIHEEYQYSEISFIPIFKNEGYQTSWISNQDMGDSFAHFLAESVHHPACIIWYSDQYAKANPEKVAALIENKDKRYRTDYVFYSILYAAGIEAAGDNKQVNIFR